MKMILQENKESELTITIEYPQKNEKVERMIRMIKREDYRIKSYQIAGSENGREYYLYVSDIYYIESVEKKVFIYTRNEVFRSNQRLYQLEKELEGYGFVKVNKCCLLNISVMEHLKVLANSKLEACLINSEKIVVSRTYIANIKRELQKDM